MKKKNKSGYFYFWTSYGIRFMTFTDPENIYTMMEFHDTILNVLLL